MATTKQRANKQKDKEKKEKIVLGALVLVLVVVGAVMLPGMFKKSGPAAAPAPATTQAAGASTSTISSGTPSNVGTPSAGGSGASGAATFPEAFTYQPGEGQLSGFGRLAGNDPFANLPSQTSATASTSTTPTTFPAAVISINGTETVVALNGSFPESGAFTLDAITAKSITVSVTDGSFSGGRSSVTIRKGHTVVLVNTVDGTRYALKMISAGVPVVIPVGTTTSLDTTSEIPTTTGP